MLRLSLEDDPEDRGGQPLRQGRAIGWITEALEPVRDQLSDDELHQLVLAIRSATGIEALVWLTDIGGLSRDAAVELMRWSAQSMLAGGPLHRRARARGLSTARRFAADNRPSRAARLA